jgi:hypothetical protein
MKIVAICFSPYFWRMKTLRKTASNRFWYNSEKQFNAKARECLNGLWEAPTLESDVVGLPFSPTSQLPIAFFPHPKVVLVSMLQ